MKNLDQQQREMRERNQRVKVKAATIQSDPVRTGNGDCELDALRNRVSVLELENAAMRQEIVVLRKRSGRAEKSYEEQRREQQHNFFKYSNVQRY
jgi:hypothetical protein